jgi:hypothetical protein
MRWSTYLSPADGTERIAVVRGGILHGSRSPHKLVDLLGDDGAKLAAAAGDILAYPLEQVSCAAAMLLAPIPVPPSIRDFMAFEDHLKPILKARGLRWTRRGMRSRRSTSPIPQPSWGRPPTFTSRQKPPNSTSNSKSQQ